MATRHPLLHHPDTTLLRDRPDLATIGIHGHIADAIASNA